MQLLRADKVWIAMKHEVAFIPWSSSKISVKDVYFSITQQDLPPHIDGDRLWNNYAVVSRTKSSHQQGFTLHSLRQSGVKNNSRGHASKQDYITSTERRNGSVLSTLIHCHISSPKQPKISELPGKH